MTLLHHPLHRAIGRTRDLARQVAIFLFERPPAALEDLQSPMDPLSAAIKQLQDEIADLQLQMKKAGAEREAAVYRLLTLSKSLTELGLDVKSSYSALNTLLSSAEITISR